MTDIASLVVRIGADASQLQGVLGRSERDLKAFGSGFSLQKISDGFSNLASKIMPISVGLAGIGAIGISQASDFEAAMNEISARTGLTGDALENISNIALDMGAKTAFSSQQAADAFLQLLSSGQSTEEAIATLPSVLDAAAASGMGLGAAADSITDIMAMFGIEASEAGLVAEALARASGASSASMSDLSEAFANVGAKADAYGLSVDRTAAILAIFAENGTKGADAGTQLRSMLTNMTRDTESVDDAWAALGTSLYTTDGQLRELPTVLEDIKLGLADMTTEEANAAIYALAGAEGELGLRALLAGISIEEMESRMQSAASASAVAQARMQGFKGRVDSLGGSVEALNIRAFGPFLEKTAGPFVEWLTEGVNAMGVWVQKNPELTQAILEIGTAAVIAGPALASIGAGLALLASPVIATAAAFAAAGVAIAGTIAGISMMWRENTEGFREGATLVGEKVGELAGVIGEKIGQIKIGETTIAEIASNISSGLRDAIQRGLDAISGFFNVEDSVQRAFGAGADVDSERSGVFLVLGQKIAAGLQGAIDGIEAFDVSTLNQTITDTLNLISIDTTAISGNIQTGLQTVADGLNAIDLTGVQTWATDNFQSILDTIVSVAAIILGGPISLTIGAAKLITNAIESDFLGIGTLLSESGIIAEVERGFNTLKSQIETAIQSVFGGGGSNAIDPTEGLLDSRNMGVAASGGVGVLDRLGQDLAKGLDFIKGIFERVGPGIQTGLNTFFDGVSGFFEALRDTDTEGLYEVVKVVGGVLGGIVSLIGTAVGQGIETSLTLLGNVLPKIGQTISSLIEAVGNLGQGDWGGMIQSLGDAFGSWIGVLVAIPENIGNGLIGFIEKLTGFDLPSIGDIFGDIVSRVKIGVEDVSRFFSRLGLEIKMFFLGVAADVGRVLYDFTVTNDTSNLLPDFSLSGLTDEIQSVSDALRGMNLADSLRAGFDAGNFREVLKETALLTGDDLALDISLAQLTAAIAGGGEGLRVSIQNAIQTSLSEGNMEDFNFLMQLAPSFGVDVITIQQQVASLMQGALNNLGVTITSAITVSPLLQNIANVIDTVRSALTRAPLAATVQAMISVSPILSGVTSAISAVVAAITGAGGDDGADGSHAAGLGYVPFDGYRAILHKGEAVIPASENRRRGDGQAPVQNVFNLHSYGQSPQEFMEWVKRLMAEGAY